MALKSLFVSLMVVCSSLLVTADEPGFVPSTGVNSYGNGPHYGAPAATSPASYPDAETNSIEDDNSLQSYEDDPSGFGVQTGYEGYLVPEEDTGALGVLTSLFPQLGKLGSFGTDLMTRGSSMFMGLAGVVAIGGVLTTAVCVLTPLCTLTFAGLARANNGIIGQSVRSYLTPEKLDAATSFMKEAFEKYSKLNKKVRSATIRKRNVANKKK